MDPPAGSDRDAAPVSTRRPGAPAPNGREWWHGGVIYQIYVRSWQDSDADGYGDLPGVLAGLGYLAWLGVDAIWLSPTMPSPDVDWGYDVADYREVHRELGTLAGLQELVDRAGELGIRVLLDLVPNHTSDAHPWFVAARGSPESPVRDYYVWAPGRPGGHPPNNWRDATGAPAWSWDEGSGQYYLHNYLPGQPDLNWWAPAVGAEFEEILRFWLDRGVAGFRIDVAHGLYKDAELRDNPPADPGRARGGLTESRFGLDPVYNANRPEVHGVYRRWREIADGYDPPRLLLGETWVADLARLAWFYGSDDELHLAFNFPFLFAAFTAPTLAAVVAKTYQVLPAGACPVWTASNHDVSRLATRWCGGDERKVRLALVVLATLPGTLALYYGDELGMPDVAVPESLRRDAMTRHLGPEHHHRDDARTPMPWDASATGGFTTPGVVPWLPLGEVRGIDVATQRADPKSVLALCRELLALRHRELIGAVDGYAELFVDPGLWVYQVRGLVVAANFSDAPRDLGQLPATLLPRLAAPLLRSCPGGEAPGGPRLGAWEALVARAPSRS